MKKPLQLIIVITILLTSLSTYGQIRHRPTAGYRFYDGDVRYEFIRVSYNSLSWVKVIGYRGQGGNVEIPETVPYSYLTGISVLRMTHLSCEVTSIGDHAFRNKQLTHVTIPTSVQTIGYAAFAYNRLSHVTIPNSVYSIGDHAFDGNQLVSVIISKRVNRIGKATFQSNRLTKVTIPKRVRSIGDNAFYNNGQITEIQAPGVWPPSLGYASFWPRGQIRVYVPKGRKRTYERAGWTGFKSVWEPAEEGTTFTVDHITYKITTLNSGNKQVMARGYYTAGGRIVHIPRTVRYQGDDYKVTAIGNKAFFNKQLTEVTIPKSVTSIGYEAFYNNRLTKVIITDNLARIEENAFGNNPDLSFVAVIEVGATSTPIIHENTFWQRDQKDILVPKGRIQAYENNGWDEFRSITEIPEVGNTFIVGHITYKITTLDVFNNNNNNNRQVMAIGYNTLGGPIVNIPRTVENGPYTYNVTAIGQDAFREKELEEVTIPDEVTSIGSHAFAYNELDEVTIPDGVNDIGIAAFAVNQLDSVTIPNSMTSIPNYAFHRNQLKSVTIPNTVTSIGDHAFHQNQLSEVTIPNSVTTIGEAAFLENQLTRVTIPEGVRSIAGHVFRDNQLTSIKIPNSMITIGHHAFSNNLDLNLVAVEASDPPALKASTFINPERGQIDLIVPKDRVEAYLGNGWTEFKSISDAELNEEFTVDHITYRITSIAPNTVTVTDYSIIGGPLTIPQTVQYQDIDYAVTIIGDEAFKDNQLTEVIIPKGVTSIGEDAFWKNQLTSVVIPKSVTSLGQRAFGTNKLDSVTIPDGVTSIGQWVFAANQLTEVTIPASVESIGYQAFYNNPNLDLVTVERNDPPALDTFAFVGFNNTDLRHQIDVVVSRGKRQTYLDDNGWTGFNSITEEVEDGDFFAVGNLRYQVTFVASHEVNVVGRVNGSTETEITIPETVRYGPNTYAVTAIGNEAFLNKQLTGVTIPDGVTSIGESAFQDNELTSVTIPSTVTSIGDWAFQINQLNSVEIPDGVSSIGYGTFRHNQLTEVTLSENVKEIGYSAFAYNLLSEVTIPSSVTSIRQMAFVYNPVKKVTAKGSTIIPNIVIEYFDNFNFDPEAFTNQGDIDLIVPKGKKQAYEAAGWADFKSITEGIELSIEGAPSKIESLSSFYITFQFARDVTGFTVGDISLDHDHATLSDFTGSGSSYTVKVTPTTCNGVIKITVPEDIAEYAPNFLNSAASATITVTALPEVPTISSSSPICAGQNAVFTISGTAGDIVTYDDGASTKTITIPADGKVDVTVNGIRSAATLNLTQVSNGSCSISLTEETATVTVNATPPAPSVSSSPVEYCVDDAATALTAKGTDLLWYTTLTGGTPVAPIPNTENAGKTSYYVSQTTSCGESERTEIVVTVNATPSAQLSTPASAVCSGEDAIFTISGTADDIVTYDDGASTKTITIPADGKVDVTVNGIRSAATLNLTQVSNGSCSISLTEETATVTVNATPPAPSVSSSPVEYCVDDAATALTAKGTDLLWYTTLTGGTPVAPIPNTENAGKTSYYVSQTTSCGESERTEIVVTVNATPSAQLSTPASAVCSGEDAIFTISGTADDIVTYDDGASTKTITIPADGKVDVTVNGIRSAATLNLTQVSNGSCSISLTEETATVTVNAIPSAPSVNSPVEYCVGETADALTAKGTDLLWYTTLTGGTLVAPIPNTENAGKTSYYVSQTTSCGESERAEIMVIVEACSAQIGNVFTVSDMNYKITTVNPHTVVAIGMSEIITSGRSSATTSPGTITIPEMTSHEGATYTVTAIGANAFNDNPDLGLVTVEATHPPSLHKNAFSDRSQVILIVPMGKRQAYLDNGWDGFRSIIEEGLVLTARSNNQVNDFTLYPNPARDKVHIDPGSGQELKQVNIYRMTGAYLYSEYGREVNTSRLSRGMYLFEIVTKTGNRSMKKVIIQ